MSAASAAVVTGQFGAVGGGGDDERMRRELDGVQVSADGWRERCATTIEPAGGYVVVVTSVVQSRAITLVSCYLGDLHRAETGVSHLCLAAGERTRIAQRTLGEIAGQTHARACLLDHVAQLRELLDELIDKEVSIELGEQALAQATAAWR